MTSTFEIGIDNTGFSGIDLYHDMLLCSKDGVNNPYAYRLGLNRMMHMLIRMEYNEDIPAAKDFINLLDKDYKELNEMVKLTADKYGF